MASDDYEAIFGTEDVEAIESVLRPEGRWEESRWEESDEEARAPRYVRGPISLSLHRAPFRPIGGVSGASIQTPAGRAQVQFGKAVATQEAVNNLARELKGEIAGLVASVKKVNETLDKNTAMLDKKVNTVGSNFKKAQEQNQMMALLPLLLTKAPAIQKIKFKDTPTAGTDTDVESVTFKKDESSALLPLVLLMGMGSGGVSGDSMSMMMMALVLSGGLK
jgi:hypothetical protein